MSESGLWNHVGGAQSLLSVSKWSPLNGVLMGTTLGSFPTAKSKIYVLRAGVNCRESLLHRTNSVNKFGGRGTMTHRPGGLQGGEKGVWTEEGGGLSSQRSEGCCDPLHHKADAQGIYVDSKKECVSHKCPPSPSQAPFLSPFQRWTQWRFNQVQLEKPSESVSHSVTSDSLHLHMDCSPPASSDHGIPQTRACVTLWLILVHVWQKTTKFWKAIILQLKKNFF